jgi:uroporphyrinogen-III decarboxylase
MKDKMTSKERIHAVVAGQPVDRVPIFIWLNAHSGAKLIAEYEPSNHWHWNLAAKFLWGRFIKGGEMDAHELWRGLPLVFDVHSFNWANLYATELGSDMLMAAHATPWDYTSFGYKDGHITMEDMFGVKRAIGGIYPDMVGPAVTTIEEVVNYKFKMVHDDKLYNVYRKARRDYPDKCITAEIWGPQDFTATSLIGMERFMMFLIDYPEEMHKFLGNWTDSWIEVIRKSVKAGADSITLYDDYGYDNRCLISMPMWEEFTKPYLKKMVDAAHEAGALVMQHSCGYQKPFLDHYVELGIDMLQSFQPGAGNDFEQSYADYGDKLTFVTGIDIQRGESMTPAELKDEIIHNYKVAGRNGHHVLGFSHEVQYTMPTKNLAIVFDTIKEINEGRYDD